jgi:hypothetical protein
VERSIGVAGLDAVRKLLLADDVPPGADDVVEPVMDD